MSDKVDKAKQAAKIQHEVSQHGKAGPQSTKKGKKGYKRNPKHKKEEEE